jgi:membrane associated rhomboid family serine protease
MQCYRHPDRETGVACSRCDRPICSDCMTPTSVGMRCPECAGDSTKVRRPAPSGGGFMGVHETGFWAAPATWTLIGVNVAVFVLQLATGGGGFSTETGWLSEHGSLCGYAVGNGGACAPPPMLTEGGELWRVVSAGFLHGSLIHIALNMFVLYILGTMLEPAIGTPRTVAVYFVSLIAGSLGALILADPFQNTVGASGAIYGLFAAALLIAHDRGMTQVVSQLGFWLILNLVLTFSVSGISIGGHLGGIAGGVVAGLIVIAGERRGGETQRIVGIELAALIGIAAAFFVGAVLVAQSAEPFGGFAGL